MINFWWPFIAGAASGLIAASQALEQDSNPKEAEMSKRSERYSPVAQVKRDRAFTAEAKAKELRLEVQDLRKQLFRAQESARIANEEADMRAQAQRQSGEALRAQLTAAREEARCAEMDVQWMSASIEIKRARIDAFQAMPLWRIAAQRIAARFGSRA